MSHQEQDFWGEAKGAHPEAENETLAINKIILIALIAVFAIFSLAGYFLAKGKLGALGADTPPETETPGVIVDSPKDEWMHILLLGTDQRANEPARSDTIILAFLNNETKEIKLLSIPRDTYAKIPGRKNNEKLGHANAYGGPPLAVEAVKDLLNIDIHRYVELNFDGFKKMVDALGGIEIDVEKRMLYLAEDINLHAGKQRLNGHDALAYVRYRSDSDDIGRIKRQQKFLKEFAEETFQLSTILKLPALVKEANKSITTNLTTGEMLSLAKSAKSFDVPNMVTATLPGEARYINKISYWIIDELETKKIIDNFLNPPAPKPEEGEEGK